MEIVKTKPPIYDKAHEQFGVEWDDGVIFTYGDKIHCKYDLSPQKVVHESIHVQQQGQNPEAWWKKYFEDKEFRLNQEMEAYAAEFLFLKDKIKDRNELTRAKWSIAQDLASPMYGSLIGFWEVMKVLK